MKIERLHIGSYGSLKDLDWTPAPGLNVIYGPNEAGKTSLKEFIAGTLFPRPAPKYPAAKASDQGEITVVDRTGTVSVLRRDGKKTVSEGIGPVCLIDGGEYRKIYALSPEDLRDTGLIENGEIRSRFLTIPGGNDLPRITETLDAERTEYLSDQRHNKNCLLARDQAALGGLREQEAALNREDSAYAALAAAQTVLDTAEQQTAAAVDEQQKLAEAARSAADRAGLRENLTNLKKREQELLPIAGADDEAEQTRQGLKNATDNATAQTAAAQTRRDAAARPLARYDPAALDRRRTEILNLQRQTSLYSTLARQGRAPGPTRAGRPYKAVALLIAGTVLALAGLALAVLSNAAGGAAMAAVGLAAVAVGLLMLRRARRKQPSRPAADSGSTELAAMERSLDAVAAAAGIDRCDFATDTALLADLLQKNDALTDTELELTAAKQNEHTAADQQRLFLQGFGGEDGYAVQRRNFLELQQVRTKIAALDQALGPGDPFVSTGDPSSAQAALVAAQTAHREAVRAATANRQHMKDILNDGSLDEAISARTAVEQKLTADTAAWARLAFEKLLLDRACAAAYRDHEPQVLADADRFLTAMTGGRYRLTQDPREPALSVTEVRTGERKTAKAWSAGLGDQIKLAVKLGVARGLSAERPPLLLDDILLTSDPVRKQGAVGALKELAGSVQVMYFTCDPAARDLLKEHGAAELKLRP